MNENLTNNYNNNNNNNNNNNIHDKITPFWLAETQSSALQVLHSAKSAIPVQITHWNSGLWLAD